MRNKHLKLQKPTTIKAQLRKAKTLNDLFAQDKLNDILNELNEQKADITHLVLFYRTNDDVYHSNSTNMSMTELLGLIEYCKDMELHPELNGDE